LQTTEKIQKGSGDTNDITSLMYNMISGILGKPETIEFREEKKPVVAIFIGPTGVGKTTTLAKIAAEYSLNSQKNVGLITADTYRIAAVDQLKVYAEIMGIPLTVIYSPGEIKGALEKYSDMDLILIDTAGRSSKSKAQFDELVELVEVSEADEVYLLVSACTSMRNCNEIIKNYSFLKDYKLIFTKIDETSVLGTILNVSFLTGKKLSYITNGQNVPDDIEVACVDSIIKNLLGSMT
jgi:flagellar biosynthesis protein FlhF